MSIASEITRLQTAKADLKTSIENKGVAVSSSATLDEYPALVDAIPTGGGGLEPKLVNFIDYDGTLLYSYDDEEFAELTALPSNPTHTDMGLVPDGWNWTLAEIQTQLTAMPEQKVWVGQMYHTASGATEIDVEIKSSDFLKTRLLYTVNGTITIDWGDSSTPEQKTGNQVDVSPSKASHTYSSIGTYTIKIMPIDSNTSYSWAGFTNERGGYAYKDVKYFNSIERRVRLGVGFSFASYNNMALCGAQSLEYITVPSTIQSFCYTSGAAYTSLQAVVIPRGVTTLANGCFSNSFDMFVISLPYTMIDLGQAGSALAECVRLKWATLPANLSGRYGLNRVPIEELYVPSGMTSTSTQVFNQNPGTRYIFIPDGLTNMTGNMFTYSLSLEEVSLPAGVELGSFAFQYCRRLKKVTIRPGVATMTSIPGSAFNYAGIEEFDVPSSVTVIDASAFSSCTYLERISFPQGLLEIKSSAFYNCNLHEITIPSSVTSIGGSAFSSNNSLAKVMFMGTTPPTLGSSVFNSSSNELFIYVPSGTLNTYKSATNYPAESSYITYVEY